MQNIHPTIILTLLLDKKHAITTILELMFTNQKCANKCKFNCLYANMKINYIIFYHSFNYYSHAFIRQKTWDYNDY